jgi:two-component system chemotaxis sensor kinase CheA
VSDTDLSLDARALPSGKDGRSSEAKVPGSRLFTGYATAQAIALALFFFVPLEGWLHVAWQVMVGWAGAAFVLVGVRRHRPAGLLAWYFFATGVFLNTTGILVAQILGNPSQIVSGPTVADAFWLGLFPNLAAGMAVLIRHRTIAKDWASLVDAAIITTGFGLLAWVFVIRPEASDANLTILTRTTAIAYVVGDLVILGMMVRLVLGGGTHSMAFRLMVTGLLSMLSADIGWAVVNQLGVTPPPAVQHLLEMASMTTFVLFGASAVHPSTPAVSKGGAQRRTYLSPTLLLGLTVASLIAPAILFFQVFRHNVTDGGAIAVSATILFVLVVVRMAQLLRRVEEHTRELAERNRAVRLVLETVNEGLLRISQDGTLLLERSAMIDKWFRSFNQPMPFVRWMSEFDENFAAAFKLGHEALLEDVLPLEVCLAQLPARLEFGNRSFKVSYLPVSDGAKKDGLLVVIEDITEQLLLAHKDAEQRELLAMFQALTRDRLGFLSFFDEASGIVERVASGTLDTATQKRLLHTLKGNASMVSLNLITQLCHEAEDEVDGLASRQRSTIDALARRWLALADAFRMFVGEQGRDAIAVQPGELEDLADDIRRGTSTPALLEKLAAWRDEPAERALARLAQYARALAQRLDKGALAIELDGHGVRLDPRRWGPLWSELVHVIRNALDHGFESPDERRSAGKPPELRLRLGAELLGSELCIEIEDDGRGIDWEAIRRSARRCGLLADTDQDLKAALLTSGVTGQDQVSTLSGRGVGMSAVAARVAELGGRVDVVSRAGAGTTWRFVFPTSSLTRHPGPGGLRPGSRSSGSAAA